MAFEALFDLLPHDGEMILASGEDVRITSDTALLVGESRPPVPEGYIDGQTGGYWQDPVSKKWHFITGAGHYNDNGIYIFDNLFKR